ncbi:hypothetical protein ANN_09590 [Periplaneta americana]|uniref:Uncharacterized protein n=1 Tax=Periplaneta americana TaxID=6978 RepID=A0ABQ8TLQ6_PERAM|nr:hypothetical protein ANN_09590 [Periplaneta americana]
MFLSACRKESSPKSLWVPSVRNISATIHSLRALPRALRHLRRAIGMDPVLLVYLGEASKRTHGRRETASQVDGFGVNPAQFLPKRSHLVYKARAPSSHASWGGRPVRNRLWVPSLPQYLYQNSFLKRTSKGTSTPWKGRWNGGMNLGRVVVGSMYRILGVGSVAIVISWPLRSPDFTALAYCMWNWLKSEVYKRKEETREELLARILHACAQVKECPNQLRKNDAETDQEEEKDLAGSLAEKKLPIKGCTGRKGEREKSSGQKKILDDKRKIYQSKE